MGVSSAHARALVAPPSLCIFHTAFIRRRMVLALVQDWASSAAVPLMGGPRVGATSNPWPGVRAEGAPDSSIRWAPAPILELITLRSNRRPPLFSWTAVRCAVALSSTLSCFVVKRDDRREVRLAFLPRLPRVGYSQKPLQSALATWTAVSRSWPIPTVGPRVTAPSWSSMR